MSESRFDASGLWMCVWFIFFMALRGCNHADENEQAIDSLEQKIRAVEQEQRDNKGDFERTLDDLERKVER
jgi:hypothetical protein